MKGSLTALAACFAFFLLAGQLPAAAPPQKEVIAETNLKVGQVAPDFSLPSNQRTTIKLSDFRGKKNVILAFYILAFTPG